MQLAIEADACIVLFERSPAGLERRQVLTLARFVRLHGRHGFWSRP